VISTHILDTANGLPAAGVPVTLSRRASGDWSVVASAVTDADGRIKEFAVGRIEAGDYRLEFDTAAYSTFYPEVSVVFTVKDAGAHHHIPLLLAPFGYSTYRGT
jgi:5-hydroxyisourate hydrolase